MWSGLKVLRVGGIFRLRGQQTVVIVSRHIMMGLYLTPALIRTARQLPHMVKMMYSLPTKVMTKSISQDGYQVIIHSQSLR